MNKRLIIVFSSIAVIVLTLVIGAIIFTVSDIKVLVPGDVNQTIDMTGVLNVSGIERGTSIFTVDEKGATAKIEKEYPTAKVVKIERFLPNKIRINIVVRVPILAMKVTDTGKHVLLDREMKIIEVVDSSTVGELEIVNVVGEELAIDNIDNVDTLAGSFISTENLMFKQAIMDTVLALETYGNTNERLYAFADEIVVNSSKGYLHVKTNVGAKLVVRINAGKTTAEQMTVLYKKLDELTDAQRVVDNYIYIDVVDGVKWTQSLPSDLV